MNKYEVVDWLLKDRRREPGARGAGAAPANIALCKYWGKRNEELNLPVTSSLSVSLGNWGTVTEVRPADINRIWLNGTEQDPDASFARRIVDYLRLFHDQQAFEVRTTSTVPIGAGLASSASGFAALARALDDCHGWALDGRVLSILARLGSGSACRSIYHGFVQWHAGSRSDGMDSFAGQLDIEWPDLCIGVWTVSAGEKSIGSRDAMARTRNTSSLYPAWPEKVSDDLVELHCALRDQDFERLGRTAESNALAMHATMWSAWPPVCYWLPESISAIQAVWAARADGLPVYFTMDAGPNIKLLFSARDTDSVLARFPSVQLVNRFEKLDPSMPDTV